MQRLAVRQLAEFVFRQGDLHPARYARGVEAAEGIACQQKIQERRRQGSSAFESEVSVRADVEIDFTPTRLAGRIDGLFRGAQGVWRIEEYKTTRALEVDLSPIDWAQCLIYAGLLTQQQSLERIELAVIYVHPESLAEQIFERSICATTAQVSLAFALLCYEARRRLHRLRCERRTLWMQTRDFPFERYRSAQRSAARKVYRTLENGEHLLLEAPTGSGKSMATIYPALKFMRSEQQLFFLTNRSTGAEAALKSAGFIADSSNCLSVVQITAKDKMCRSGGVPCEPQDCARCKNYFARAPYAVNRLLGMGVVDRFELQQVAAKIASMQLGVGQHKPRHHTHSVRTRDRARIEASSLLLSAVVAVRRLITCKGFTLFLKLIEVVCTDNRCFTAGSVARPRIAADAQDGAVHTPLFLWPLLSPPYFSL